MSRFEKISINDTERLVQFVEELIKEGEDCSAKFRRLAERNEMFVQGDQCVNINPANNQISNNWPDYLPQIIQNHLPGLKNTWKARQLKERPSVTAFPTSEDPNAIASSEISAKLIEYEEKELQIDLLLDDVVGLRL